LFKYFSAVILFFIVNLPAEKLKVTCTITDLASIVKTVAGEEADVTTLVPARSNPHYLVAKPSYIRSLSRADLFVKNGLELEIGWAPVLLNNCRNGKVQPGTAGFFDASDYVIPKYDKVGRLTRADGHVHPLGNPHFILDPVVGISVADGLCSRFSVLRPEKKKYFE